MCPLCGSRLGRSDAPAGGPASAPAGVALPSWEDGGVGFPANLFATWWRSMSEPTRFFRGVPFEAPLLRPLLYYLIIAMVSALFTLWWQAVGTIPTGWFDALGVGRGADAGAGGGAVFQFFLAPFAALIGLVVWGLALHLFVLLFAPSRRALGATLRVLVYSSGPTALTALPWIGPLLGTVWGLVLSIIGMREAHRTTPGRAAAIVLIPVGLFLLFFLALFVLFIVGAGRLLLE
ncbi:MAG: YIP1 family protein [Gemmatimonadota bacterium]